MWCASARLPVYGIYGRCVQAQFLPLPLASSLSEQMHFGDPVVLLRKPFRLSFAYAGPDPDLETHVARPSLPAMIKLTVRDSGTERVLSVSTITPVHVQVPSDCVKPDGSCDDKDKTEDKSIASPNAPDARKPTPPRPGQEGDAMTRDRTEPSSSEQGVVIVAVLWILMALSALAVIVVLSVRLGNLAVNASCVEDRGAGIT